VNDQPHPISIVVADDHPVVLHGVADVLRLNSDMNVVAVCSDGATALEAIRKYSPDVAVLDIAMPGMTGLDVLDRIAADGLATKVVLLAASANDEQLCRAVAGGVRGIVLKEEALTELVQCIRAVAVGELLEGPRPDLDDDVAATAGAEGVEGGAGVLGGHEVRRDEGALDRHARWRSLSGMDYFRTPNLDRRDPRIFCRIRQCAPSQPHHQSHFRQPGWICAVCISAAVRRKEVETVLSV